MSVPAAVTDAQRRTGWQIQIHLRPTLANTGWPVGWMSRAWLPVRRGMLATVDGSGQVVR